MFADELRHLMKLPAASCDFPRCRRRRSAAIPLIAFVFATLPAATLFAAEDLREIVMHGLQSSQRPIDGSSYNEVDLSSRVTAPSRQDAQEGSMSYQVAFLDGNVWHHVTTSLNDDSTVAAWNEDYYFAIRRNEKSQNWALMETEPYLGSNARQESLKKEYELFHNIEFRASHVLVLEAMADLSSSVDVRRSESSPSLLEVTVTGPSPKDGSGRFGMAIDEVRAVLDEANGFRVTSYVLKGPIRRIAGTQSYRSDPQDPSAIEITRNEQTETQSTAGVYRVVQTASYRVRNDYVPTDANFYLSDYDLPEPTPIRTASSYRTPAWLYYFFGGVLSVMAGAFLVHRVTRRSGGA
ncbi:MAG TPA: hypothetical protein VGN57_15215 [Pirellulaceae bacterium]|jgi:hypothetical protein|nr:hypothetical protein [Pirellulaceae bacterium]